MLAIGTAVLAGGACADAAWGAVYGAPPVDGSPRLDAGSDADTGASAPDADAGDGEASN